MKRRVLYLLTFKNGTKKKVELVLPIPGATFKARLEQIQQLYSKTVDWEMVDE